MTSRVFYDTNVLVYALDPSEGLKQSTAAQFLRRGMATGRLVVSPQTLNECFRVLVYRRRLVPPHQAEVYVRSFFAFCNAPSDLGTTVLAWELVRTVRAGWWDSLMMASAIRFGCTAFLTEDRQGRPAVSGMEILDLTTTQVDRLFPSAQ